MKTWNRTFNWRFPGIAPAALWPALADTGRWNEAAGIPKHTIAEVEQPDRTVHFMAATRRFGLRLAWREVPVEWVDGQWFRHCREFSTGPIRTLCATLTLEDDGDGGTAGHYLVEVTAANILGTAALATVFFPVVRRIFTRLADGARAWAAGQTAQPFTPKPAPLTGPAQTRLHAILETIEASPNGHGLAKRLADWMLAAQEMDLMRMRPLALAAAWGEPPRHVVEMCLQGVADGLLELRWDLLCPRCRGAKLTTDALDRLPRDAHCASCNIDYDRDFARNVELTFHPAPAVRDVIDGEFCLFGPMTTPHVKVQITLAPGDSQTIALDLAPGDYRLRTLEVGGETTVTYPGGPFPMVIAGGGTVSPEVPDQEHGQICLTNAETVPRTVIIESRAWAGDALTAHQVTTSQTFRDLFTDQMLGPGDQVDISQVTLMFTDLKDSTAFYERVGDVAAYGLVDRHFALLGGIVREHGGAIVKTIGDAVMAAFAHPADAVRAALAVQDEVRTFNAQAGGEPLTIKIGLHAGACIAVTLNERLDYFGSMVNLTARLQGQSEGADIVLSEDLATDPTVAPLIAPHTPIAESAAIKGFDAPVAFHRIRC